MSVRNNRDEPLEGIDDLCLRGWYYATHPRQVLDKLKHLAKARIDALMDYLASFLQTDCCQILKNLLHFKTFSCLLPLILFSFVPLYLLDKLDPFGLSRQVHSYSERLVQKITAPFYGSAAQDKIAVVLIDHASLAARGETWPPRYVYYEEVVRRIARQKPAAIFLDVLVEDKRAYDDSLTVARQALGETLGKAGVPLYLAALDTRNNSVFAGVPGTQTTLSGWRGYGEDYPLSLGPGHFYGQHDSQLEPGEKCDVTKNPTVAMQIYQQLCNQGLQQGCAITHEAESGEQFCDALVVQWGHPVSPIVPERHLISESQCNATEQSTWVRVGESLRAFFASLFSGYDETALKQLRQPCPYTVTVREEDLSSEKARGVLTGRVVMIGLSLPGIHDIVDSPVHGQIPGVYLHAMALDNLMTWNANYYPRKSEDIDRALLLAVILVCWPCVAIIRAQPPRLSALLRGVAIFSLVSYILFLYLVLHRPPPDWLAMLLVLELVKRLIEKNNEHTHEANRHGNQSNAG
ncbi:TPA: CHASE2 domain-containing protein [Pseudomonas aeruginosa]